VSLIFGKLCTNINKPEIPIADFDRSGYHNIAKVPTDDHKLLAPVLETWQIS